MSVDLKAYAKDVEEQIKQICDDLAPLELFDEPSPLMDIEVHQAFLSHFQQEGLASFLIRDIGAFHDFVDLKRLLAERVQDIFSIIQHNWSPTVANGIIEDTKADLP